MEKTKSDANEDNTKNDDNKDDDDADTDDKPPAITYTWYQEGDDVTVKFDLAEGTTKDDIVCIFKPDEIEIGLFNGESLLKGPLFAKVKAEDSTWTLEKNW